MTVIQQAVEALRDCAGAVDVVAGRDVPPVTADCWAVWFRNGMQPGERWYCWEGTARTRRADAIAFAIADGYGGMRDKAAWRRARRAGVVACRRTTLTAPSFGDPRFP